ncbi:hypothetical protein GCM10010279_19790 [Streptomyces mutabilis]|nr:hypothetical protein GCM10010279_19790 [Streptomyces mutabilis]
MPPGRWRVAGPCGLTEGSGHSRGKVPGDVAEKLERGVGKQSGVVVYALLWERPPFLTLQ